MINEEYDIKYFFISYLSSPKMPRKVPDGFFLEVSIFLRIRGGSKSSCTNAIFLH